MSRRKLAWGLVVLALGGCSGPDGGSPSTDREPAAVTSRSTPPVRPVRHSYFPRRDDVDYWETVPAGDADPQFFLQVYPRIKTPAEGPWVATFSDAAGDVLARLPGLRVDVATGNFLFLCDRSRFPPGDWTITLEVMEGGLSGVEPEQTFRFRVE